MLVPRGIEGLADDSGVVCLLSIDGENGKRIRKTCAGSNKDLK
jgi:hypothetical protein